MFSIDCVIPDKYTCAYSKEDLQDLLAFIRLNLSIPYRVNYEKYIFNNILACGCVHSQGCAPGSPILTLRPICRISIALCRYIIDRQYHHGPSNRSLCSNRIVHHLVHFCSIQFSNLPANHLPHRFQQQVCLRLIQSR